MTREVPVTAVRSRSARRRLAGGAALAAVAVGVLAGCGAGDQAGAAAVVDGRRIPVADLDSAMRELGPYFTNVSSANLLAVLIQAPIVIDAAEKAGVAVSEEQARDLLDSTAKAAGTDPVPDFSPASIEIAQFSLAQQALQQLPDAADISDDIGKQVVALDVEVSPRYGAVGDDNAIVPVQRPWLVTATPSPAPTDDTADTGS